MKQENTTSDSRDKYIRDTMMVERTDQFDQINLTLDRKSVV